MKKFPMKVLAQKQKTKRLSMSEHCSNKRKNRKEEEMKKHLKQMKNETEAEEDTVWLELSKWWEQGFFFAPPPMTHGSFDP